MVQDNMGTGPMGSKELLHGDRIYGQCRAACMGTGPMGSQSSCCCPELRVRANFMSHGYMTYFYWKKKI